MAEIEKSAVPTTMMLLLICPVRLYREAICTVLAKEEDLTVCGYAKPDGDLLHAYDAHSPDVVVVDTGFAGMLDAATQLIVVRPRARVLGFGVDDLPFQVVACAQAGLAGYVPSTASIHELVSAARRIAGGETVCSAAMADGLFRHVRGTALAHHSGARNPTLTQRQQQIVSLLASGTSNKEIARRLCLGTSTVKNHVHEILDRLNITSRNQVASLMHRQSAHSCD